MSDGERAALELLRDPKLVERITADFARWGWWASDQLPGRLPGRGVPEARHAAGGDRAVDVGGRQVGPAWMRCSTWCRARTLSVLRHDRPEPVLHGRGGPRPQDPRRGRGRRRRTRAYALKLLQSEGELSIASTGKDNATGRLVTHTYRVVGPVAIFLTTTAIDVDEELLNRCLVLSSTRTASRPAAIHDASASARRSTDWSPTGASTGPQAPPGRPAAHRAGRGRQPVRRAA